MGAAESTPEPENSAQPTPSLIISPPPASNPSNTPNHVPSDVKRPSINAPRKPSSASSTNIPSSVSVAVSVSEPSHPSTTTPIVPSPSIPSPAPSVNQPPVPSIDTLSAPSNRPHSPAPTPVHELIEFFEHPPKDQQPPPRAPSPAPKGSPRPSVLSGPSVSSPAPATVPASAPVSAPASATVPAAAPVPAPASAPAPAVASGSLSSSAVTPSSGVDDLSLGEIAAMEEFILNEAKSHSEVYDHPLWYELVEWSAKFLPSDIVLAWEQHILAYQLLSISKLEKFKKKLDEKWKAKNARRKRIAKINTLLNTAISDEERSSLTNELISLQTVSLSRFNYEIPYEFAKQLLSLDKELGSIRLAYVPKRIGEEMFWYEYFDHLIDSIQSHVISTQAKVKQHNIQYFNRM